MVTSITNRQIRIISQCILFSGIEEIMIRRIVMDPRCSRSRYEKGAVIYDEGLFSRSTGIILSGSVRAEKSIVDGRHMKLTLLKAGECFGASAVFSDRESYAFRLTAEKPVEVFFIPEDVIRWAMLRDSKITENYLAFLTDRLWFLDEKLTSFIAGTSERRMAVFLEANCDETGLLCCSMTGLSRQINMGRSSVYRAIGKLEAMDFVTQNGKQIQVTDRNRLRKYIGTLKND